MATGSACVTCRLIHRAYVLSGKVPTENGDSKYLGLLLSLELIVSWMLDVAIAFNPELCGELRAAAPWVNTVLRSGTLVKGTLD